MEMNRILTRFLLKLNIQSKFSDKDNNEIPLHAYWYDINNLEHWRGEHAAVGTLIGCWPEYKLIQPFAK